MVLLRLGYLFFLMPSRFCPVYGSVPFFIDLTEFMYYIVAKQTSKIANEVRIKAEIKEIEQTQLS